MTAAFTVRTAIPADGPAITEAVTASYTALMPAAYDAATLDAVLPLITQANPRLLAAGTYYVAVTAEEIVGCGGWTLERPGDGSEEGKAGDPTTGHIRHFATHPDWTGQGIGRAIYDRCETAARAAGATRFQCYASRNAVPFYAAVGFTTVREIDVPITAQAILPAVLMMRTI